MESEDLLTKAKSGDSQALNAWDSETKQIIDLLAFQAGMPNDKITKLHREVLKKFRSRLTGIDAIDAKNELLAIAVHAIENLDFQAEPAAAEGILKFEEDIAAHAAIQKLPITEKLLLILYYFHGKSIKETAVLLKLPPAVAERDFTAGLESVKAELETGNENDLQKRIDLLGKSYSRIQFPDDNTVSMEETEMADQASPVAKPRDKPPINRRTVAVLAGASLFMAAVIGTSFLFNDQPGTPQQTAAEEENPTTVSRQMVKNWEAEYEEIRSSAPERLGISPETFEQLEYVRKADELKERTFSRQNVKLLKDDPERMQDQVDVLMLSIETPRGMLDAVKDYKLMSAEIPKFLWIYTEKTDQLMTIADGILEKHQEELDAAEVNGELAAEKLLYSRGDYPEEIEKLTKALREYTLSYAVHPNAERFRTIRDINKFYEIHPFNSDMQSSFYLDILRNAPYYDETGMLWPAEQIPYSLWTMTEFLKDPTVDPGLKGKVEPILIHTFFSIVKGDINSEVFDSKGVVKEEYRIAWESLLQANSNPITFLMLPIFEEFEESGWKESERFEQLGPSDILYAIDLESKGELAEKLPNGDLKIESVTLDLEGYDYSDIIPLYEKFAATHDIDSLSGVAPMDIIKLYHYANQLEDSETMWHLTVDDVLKPSLEDYMENWKKRPEITETLETIEIYGENIHRQGRRILLMAMGTQKTANDQYHQMRDFILYTERDQIWLMQHQMDEFYVRDESFEEFDANVQKHYENLLQNGDLAKVNDATPAEIGGVFLLAREKEDIKTMRLLVNENNQSMEDEEFKMLWTTNSHLPAYSKVGRLNFRVDTYNLSGQTITGGVEVTDGDSGMANNYYFSIEKADGLWMVSDMHGY